MQLRNSWQAFLCAINEADSTNKNFGAFINAMAEKNSKNDKINALMEDPDSIIMVSCIRWVDSYERYITKIMPFS